LSKVSPGHPFAPHAPGNERAVAGGRMRNGRKQQSRDLRISGGLAANAGRAGMRARRQLALHLILCHEPFLAALLQSTPRSAPARRRRPAAALWRRPPRRPAARGRGCRRAAARLQCPRAAAACPARPAARGGGARARSPAPSRAGRAWRGRAARVSAACIGLRYVKVR